MVAIRRRVPSFDEAHVWDCIPAALIGRLTERQSAFCRAWFGPARNCATKAARMAGYHAKSGPRLRTIRTVAAVLDAGMRLYEECLEACHDAYIEQVAAEKDAAHLARLRKAMGDRMVG
jgi:hypothetical protein